MKGLLHVLKLVNFVNCCILKKFKTDCTATSIAVHLLSYSEHSPKFSFRLQIGKETGYIIKQVSLKSTLFRYSLIFFTKYDEAHCCA